MNLKRTITREPTNNTDNRPDTKNAEDTMPETAPQAAHKLEKPTGRARWSEFKRDIGPLYVANAVVALIFSASGPLAVILASGQAGNLTAAQLTSWVMAAFAFNGLLTLVMTVVYRMPMAFFWTIPGTVLVGNSLRHLEWSEVLGAFIAVGLLVTLLGLTGVAGRVMKMLPMPIVMAMVAGVFLRFGLGLVDSIQNAPVVAIPMVVVFFALSRFGGLGRFMPPVLGALLVGVAAVMLSGQWTPQGPSEFIATPVFQMPTFSMRAMIELVIPVAITVVVVQNGQGIAVLRGAGHNPPVNMATLVSGIWSLPAAAVGCVSSCLTGPTNSLLVSSGERDRQYTAGISIGLLAIVVGVFAPLLVGFMLTMPAAWIAVLGGVAMLKALQGAFVTAFSTTCTLGALVTFLVTVADLTVLNIGGAFWGIIAGYAISRFMEAKELKEAQAA